MLENNIIVAVCFQSHGLIKLFIMSNFSPLRASCGGHFMNYHFYLNLQLFPLFLTGGAAARLSSSTCDLSRFLRKMEDLL